MAESIQIEDTEATEAEAKSGRASTSLVFVVFPRVSKANAESKPFAILVAKDAAAKVRTAIHGAAADLGKSADIKSHPQADGRVKLVTTVIPRRAGKGRPKGGGKAGKKAAAPKASA